MTFFINKNTLYISENESGTTSIYYFENVQKENINIQQYMNMQCLINGCSLKGRLAGSSYLLKYSYKCPIILKENEKIIIFPTTSTERYDCKWIVYNNVFSTKQLSKNITRIFFKNKSFLDVNISKRIIDNQILKSARLESLLLSNFM